MSFTREKWVQTLAEVSGLWIGTAIVMAGKWSHLLKDWRTLVFMDLLIILLLLFLL